MHTLSKKKIKTCAFFCVLHRNACDVSCFHVYLVQILQLMEAESHSNDLDVCALSLFHFGHVLLTSDVWLSVCLSVCLSDTLRRAARHAAINVWWCMGLVSIHLMCWHQSPACITADCVHVAHAKLDFTPGPMKSLRYRWSQLAR